MTSTGRSVFGEPLIKGIVSGYITQVALKEDTAAGAVTNLNCVEKCRGHCGFKKSEERIGELGEGRFLLVTFKLNDIATKKHR